MQLTTTVTGVIEIDDGQNVEVLYNAVHPENVAFLFASGLLYNVTVGRLAYGNGGIQSVTPTPITKPSNTGTSDGRQWRSTLYNEVKSVQLVNSSDVSVGDDRGSVSTDGVRYGTPDVNPPTVLVETVDNGLTTDFVCEVYLPPSYVSYTINEIGFFSAGAPQITLPEYAIIDVGNIGSLSELPLTPGVTYNLKINNDVILVQVPITSVNATYGDQCEAFNTFDADWLVVPHQYKLYCNNASSLYPSILNGEYGGYLVVTTTGVISTFTILADSSLLTTQGWELVKTYQAIAAGDRSVNSAERLLTHKTFYPPRVVNQENGLRIRYTVTVSVE